MIYLAILSGLINLSAQTVFQKVVSMTVGDLYTTFMAVMLTFILGSALGSYHGYRLRRFLPWIELCTGLYSLLLCFLLSGPFYQWDLPLWLVILGLLPPALALGTHIPLYSYYLRQIRFGLIYGLYHWGAIIGLIAFEWYFVHAGSVKNSLLFLGLCQITLGLVLLKYFRAGAFHVQAKDFKAESIALWFRNYGLSALTVFLASSLSFYGVLWAIKTQNALTEAFRLHATMISTSIFVWMSLAGLVSKKIQKISRSALFLTMAFAFLFQQGSFSVLPVSITDLFSGSMENYFLVSLLLALYLTLPVFISSLIFVNETSRLSESLDVDQASGGLNLFASFGNILGFALGGLMAPHFWHRPYMTTAVMISMVLGFVFLAKVPKKTMGVVAICALILLSPWAFQKEQKDFLYLNRIAKDQRHMIEMTDVAVYSHALSSIALVTRKLKDSPTPWPEQTQKENPSQRMYVVDGHFSHDVWSGLEMMVGIAGSKYFDRPLGQSLVIGIGSGQAAWAVSALSQKTDMVEISPTVIDNLKILKEYNNNLGERDDLHIHMKDGFSFVRDCKPGTYDLIFNTSTYPSNFNASKLYSDEFVALAKKCLTRDGVLQTYFDYATVVNMPQFYEFLAPLKKHFQNVDIMLDPYPQVFAYDRPRAIQAITEKSVLRPEDKAFYNKYLSENKLFPTNCQKFLRNPPMPATDLRITNLDRAYLEANSLENMVKSLGKHFDFLILSDFYQPPPLQAGMFTCE
ncbi:spermidine synthase [Bdellovibrio sp. HCB337]|uniref:spermidine synthase n=1 Tax=Bdellovibrio sp. HCB337 TaxID=3394358 RepID=UPI0039A627E5